MGRNYESHISVRFARHIAVPNMKKLIIVVTTTLLVSGCNPADPNAVARDLAECKTGAMRVGNWDRDLWYASTATGQYLIECMTAKGYRRRTIDIENAYNSVEEVTAQKKSLYRSKEAKFLVEHGCFDDHRDTANIVIPDCWQK